MKATYQGNCKAQCVLGGKIHVGDDIVRFRGSYCHKACVEFLMGQDANVVYDLGHQRANQQYAISHRHLRGAVYDAMRAGTSSKQLRDIVVSDLDAIIEDVSDNMPQVNIDRLREAENLMARASLPVEVETSGHGYAPTFTFHLDINEVEPLRIHFTNTWGGDDGYTPFYRVYVTGGEADCYDEWAAKVMDEARIKKCLLDSSVHDFVGFVLEVVGAINGTLATEGLPDSAPVRTKFNDVDMEEVNRRIIQTSIGMIRKRTASQAIQSECDVIEAALHQITGD